MKRILVCGGRKYSNVTRVYEVLDKLQDKHGNLIVGHGWATGADTLAMEWAKSREQICFCFPAQWKTFKRSAGFKRNAEMLKLFEPNVVVAFPGGNGTANMVQIAEKANVRIIKLEEKNSD
jgi:hypothetical protein